MRRAIDLSIDNVKQGGGPFGAVIVRDGEVVAEGVNRVTSLCDPTAHAEVSAIRQACQRLGRFRLDDCEIYTSCEPCPMCLGAIYWAGLKRIFYAGTKVDAEEAGFSDKFIYEEIDRPIANRNIPTQQLMHDEACEAFRQWKLKEDKIEY